MTSLPQIQPNASGHVVIGVLSDTHGRLSPEAFRTLASCDPQLIIHAGDICSDDILPQLEMLAPVVAVLGNNDFPGAYGPAVTERQTFELCGIPFVVEHIRRQRDEPDGGILICGHTHVPLIREDGTSTVVNPGSVSRARSEQGRTLGCIVLDADSVVNIQIVNVGDEFDMTTTPPTSSERTDL